MNIEYYIDSNEEMDQILASLRKCLSKNIQYQKHLNQTKNELENLLEDRERALQEVLKFRQTLKCPNEPPRLTQPFELCSAYQSLSVFHNPLIRRQFHETVRFLRSYDYEDHLIKEPKIEENSYMRDLQLLKRIVMSPRENVNKRFRNQTNNKKSECKQSKLEQDSCMSSMFDFSSCRGQQQRQNVLRQIVEKLPHDGHDIQWDQIGFLAMQILRQNSNEREGVESLDVFMMWVRMHMQKQPFSEDEDLKLRQLVKRYGENRWQLVSRYMIQKHASEIKDRWYRYLSFPKKKSRWTLIEDLKLMMLVDFFGEGCWFKLATYYDQRSEVQLRERWCNVLDPCLERRKWTQEEDAELKKLHQIYGKSWSLISLKMPGRTDNELRRRALKLIYNK